MASLGDEFLHLVFEQLLSPASQSGFVVGMFFAAEQCHQDFAGVLQGVIEIHDLDRRAKTKPSHIGQSVGSIDEENDLHGQGQASTDSLLPQQRTKLFNRTKGGYIGGRVVIAHRVALFIPFMLGKDAAQIRHARFGAAVGLFARPSFQFLLAHGHP